MLQKGHVGLPLGETGFKRSRKRPKMSLVSAIFEDITFVFSTHHQQQKLLIKLNNKQTRAQ